MTKYQQLISRCRNLAAEIYPHDSASANRVASELQGLVDEAVYADRQVTDRIVAATRAILELQWTNETRLELAASYDAFVETCKVVNESNKEVKIDGEERPL